MISVLSSTLWRAGERYADLTGKYNVFLRAKLTEYTSDEMASSIGGGQAAALFSRCLM